MGLKQLDELQLNCWWGLDVFLCHKLTIFEIGLRDPCHNDCSLFDKTLLQCMFLSLYVVMYRFISFRNSFYHFFHGSFPLNKIQMKPNIKLNSMMTILSWLLKSLLFFRFVLEGYFLATTWTLPGVQQVLNGTFSMQNMRTWKLDNVRIGLYIHIADHATEIIMELHVLIGGFVTAVMKQKQLKRAETILVVEKWTLLIPFVFIFAKSTLLNQSIGQHASNCFTSFIHVLHIRLIFLIFKGLQPIHLFTAGQLQLFFTTKLPQLFSHVSQIIQRTIFYTSIDVVQSSLEIIRLLRICRRFFVIDSL